MEHQGPYILGKAVGTKTDFAYEQSQGQTCIKQAQTVYSMHVSSGSSEDATWWRPPKRGVSAALVPRLLEAWVFLHLSLALILLVCLVVSGYSDRLYFLCATQRAALCCSPTLRQECGWPSLLPGTRSRTAWLRHCPLPAQRRPMDHMPPTCSDTGRVHTRTRGHSSGPCLCFPREEHLPPSSG